MAQDKEVRIYQDGEIDLVQLFQTIWNGRKLIIKVAAIVAVIGVVIAYIIPDEYEASSKLLPESKEGQPTKLGGLAGLAGLAGVDISGIAGGGSGAITPMLYPEISGSLPFVLEILNDSVYFERSKLKTTLLTYFKEEARKPIGTYLKKYTIGIPGMIKRAIFGTPTPVEAKESPYYRISKEDWTVILDFRERVLVTMDEETGIIKIWVEMPDPYAAAQIAQKVENLLTKSVVSYTTEKAQKNLKFIQEAYDEAKLEYETVQVKLARITDRNQNVTSALAQIELQKVQQDYELAFSVFKGLASQLESAKLKLKQETPVFTVLEPVRIPAEKSSPNRPLFLIGFGILGGFIAVAYLIIKNLLNAPKDA